MLAREREHGTQLSIEEFDLKFILNDIAGEIREQAVEKNISVESDISASLILKADLTLFTRLMINLVSNALKYGKNGGYIKISAVEDKEQSLIRITVCDNGIGIAQEDLSYVFQRFYRADKSRSDGSAGLGLAFAEMIVNLHKGKIFAESKLGAGTCFTVELPKD